jgi:hypothetical protein
MIGRVSRNEIRTRRLATPATAAVGRIVNRMIASGPT